MSTAEPRVPVPGSERRPLPDARVIGPADPNERITVTVRVRTASDAPSPAAEALAASLPHERHYLSREEYETLHGAAPDDLAAVEVVCPSAWPHRGGGERGATQCCALRYGWRPDYRLRGRSGTVRVAARHAPRPHRSRLRAH